jgi:hypothetical protein
LFNQIYFRLFVANDRDLNERNLNDLKFQLLGVDDRQIDAKKTTRTTKNTKQLHRLGEIKQKQNI